MIVQSGASPMPDHLIPSADSIGIRVQAFDYKNSITDEIHEADLVIAHAGMQHMD